MTTSVTGISSKPAARPRRAARAPGAARGFTLIEVMVVMLIIAIIMGFAVLSLGPGGREQDLESAARRVMALMELAGDQAIMRSEELAIQFEEGKYRFLRLEQDGWLPVEDDPLLRERELADGLALQLHLDDLELTMDAGEEETTGKPMVFLLSSGEMTPFELVFTAEQEDTRFVLKGDALGEFELERRAR